MRQRWWVVILAGLVALSLLLRSPALLSSALGNVGLVTLNKALIASPEAGASERLAEAEVWLKLALGSNAGNRGAHRALGWILLMQGLAEEAAAEWRAAGLTAYDFVVRGEQARLAGGYAEAKWWYEQAALLASDLRDEWRAAGLTAQDFIARGERAYRAQEHSEVQWWYGQAVLLAPDLRDEWQTAGLTAQDFITRGERAHRAGQYAEAQWWYEQAALLASDLRDEWQAAGLTGQDFLARGQQAHAAQRYEDALWWYGQAEVLEQGLQSRVLYLEYLTLTEDGDTGSAVAKLQEAVSLNQGWLDEGMRFEAWYLWGVYLYEEGRGVEAEDALTKAIAAHPQGEELQWEHSEAYRLLGLVQQAQGKLGQAVQSLEMAVRVNEGNAWAHIHLGQVLYRYDAQRAAEVDEEFALALSLQPGESRIWGALIHFWVREGEVERAESLYLQGQQEGIVLSREDLLAWGEQAYRAGAYQEALRWYERVEVLEQGLQSRVLYLEYLTLTEDGDTGSAVAKLQEAVSLNQGWLDEGMRFEAWYLWGVYLYEEGRGVEAEDALTKAIAAHPQGEELQWEHSEAYRLLGLVQQAQGKLGQAVQSLEMAVRVNEGNAWAHIHLGQVLYRYDPRRAPEVEKEFSTGLSLRSSDVGLWRSLIGFWLRVRETDRAASLCLQAREKGIVSGLEEVCPAS